MEREEIERRDFPTVGEGYDRASVEAHLAAVAAVVEALRARVDALGVEIEAIRRSTPTPDPEGGVRDVVPGEVPVPDRPDREDRSEDPVSARLLASKLHLDGLGREEIIARISSGYRLEDPDALVDEVIEGLS